MIAVVIERLNRRSFFVRYLTLFGGEAFSKLCVLLAFAYLARALGPRDFGIVELAISVTIFFVLGVENGLGSYGARLVSESPERISQLVPKVILLRACLGVPAYLLILAGSRHYGLPGLGIVAIYGGTVLITPFFTQWVFQGLRQMQWVAIGTAVRYLTFAALVFLLVKPHSDVRLVAVAELCGVAVLATFQAVLLYGVLKVRLNWRGSLGGAFAMFRETWYLGASDITWAGLWYSPSLVIGFMGLAATEYVAWLAAAVRIVMALHTFVYLYFFNMIPNLTKELAEGIDGWRDLIERSLSTSIWPACLIALGGTLVAPLIITAIYGPDYVDAVLPLQIVIWMIPVTWFSGHFRFTLIASGHQRLEFAASAVAATITASLAVVFVFLWGSPGAALALLAGGVVNTVLAWKAMTRVVGRVAIGRSVAPAIVTTTACLALGLGVGMVTGPFVSAVAGCLVFSVVAVRQDNDLMRLSLAWVYR
jgi:O-antigen/teichoic acid export membrane protein